MASEKTQAMRMLDAKRIPYTAKVYDAGRSFHSADEAAAMLGVSAESVYKTLVVLREGANKQRPMLVIVPSDREIDLRRLANVLGEKKVRMATQREAERLTGLQVGGISALALVNRPFDVLLDDAARAFEHLHVSAGQRGVDLEIATEDFVRVTNARFVSVTTDSPAG